MASYNIEYNFEIVDVNGDVATVRIPSNQGDARTLAQLFTTASTIEPLVMACSNGKAIRVGVSVLFSESALVVGASPPTNAEYSSVTDGARLQFATVNGGRTSLTIPAAIEAVFGTSSNVVDSTNAAIAALIAIVATDASDKTGTAFTLYKGGIKVGRRARRRRSSLVP